MSRFEKIFIQQNTKKKTLLISRRKKKKKTNLPSALNVTLTLEWSNDRPHLPRNSASAAAASSSGPCSQQPSGPIASAASDPSGGRVKTSEPVIWDGDDVTDRWPAAAFRGRGGEGRRRGGRGAGGIRRALVIASTGRWHLVAEARRPGDVRDVLGGRRWEEVEEDDKALSPLRRVVYSIISKSRLTFNLLPDS